MSFGLPLSVSLLLLALMLILVPASDAWSFRQKSGLRLYRPGHQYGYGFQRYGFQRGHGYGYRRSKPSRPARPNILFIMADDLGWNDVSWNNPSVITPNLQKLADEGVILNQSYVQPVCTPSRAAYLSGVYPFKSGLQQAVVRPGVEDFLPVDFVLLPEILKNKFHYSTHLVGKWHLGHCRKDATPTLRGFDSFVGVYNGATGFFNKTTVPQFNPPGQPLGFDLHFNLDILRSNDTEYITDLFTRRTVDIIKKHDETKPLYISLHYTAPHEPLEVPPQFLEFYPNVQDPFRQAYLAMVTAMDQSIGKVVQALKDRGLFSNTITVFTSDNGGVLEQGGASNEPLRGAKFQLFEGGTRSPTFVHSQKHILKPKRVSDELFHIVDWYPTLLAAAAAGDKKKQPKLSADRELDGIDQWDMISSGTGRKRLSFVYNIFKDDFNAFRYGRYKLTEGDPANGFRAITLRKRRSVRYRRRDLKKKLKEIFKLADVNLSADLVLENVVTRSRALDVDWLLERLSAVRLSFPPEKLACNKCQLYDLKADPSETTDLAPQRQLLVWFLSLLLELFKDQEVPLALKIPFDIVPESNPLLNNNSISTGWCEPQNYYG